jgi:hypothetical protein
MDSYPESQLTDTAAFDATLVNSGFSPDKRLGVLVVASMNASMCCPSCLTDVNDAPCRDFPSRIENQISTWFSQEARVWVK